MSDEIIPDAPKDLKPLRTWREWWPGKIGVDRTGNMSGCRSKVFAAESYKKASDEMNAFFEANPGLLSTEIQPIVGMKTEGFHLLYTKYTSEEEMIEFNRVESKVRELLDKEDAVAEQQRALMEVTNAKAAKETATKEAAEAKELKRLADLGRRHEKNCGKKGTS